jgi:hypothetical protein
LLVNAALSAPIIEENTWDDTWGAGFEAEPRVLSVRLGLRRGSKNLTMGIYLNPLAVYRCDGAIPGPVYGSGAFYDRLQ